MTSQSNLKYADKKEAILEAALQLLVVSGFHGTPTSKVAERAGVSNGTLFHYFSNKETLVKELYVHVKIELLDHSLSGLEKIAGFRGMLKLLWNKTVEWALQNPDKFYFLHQFKFSPYLKLIQDENIDALEERIVMIFDQAIKKGLAKQLPAELMVQMAYQQMNAMTSHLEKHPEEKENMELRNTVFEIFWDSIRIDPLLTRHALRVTF